MEKKFVVTFYDDDQKTILDKQEVYEGEKVEYSGSTPIKETEQGIEYTFIGWETEGNLENVTENVDVFAKYEASLQENEKNDEDKMYRLSEMNAENAMYNEVIEAGHKLEEIKNIVEKMTPEEKAKLVTEVKSKGSVDLENLKDEER